MPSSRNAQPDGKNADANVPEDMVTKVGAAVGHVAMIRQDYTQRVQAASTDDEREQLADQAQQAAVKAIGDQGITVSDYNRVVTAAEGNPDLENRLLQAARSAD